MLTIPCIYSRLCFLVCFLAPNYKDHSYNRCVDATLQLVAYIMIAPGGPYPIMCISFCMSGFGIAFQNAQANGFVGGLKNSQIKFSILHCSYGKSILTFANLTMDMIS